MHIRGFSAPTNISSPTGWTEIVIHCSASDGYAIQEKDSADPPSVEFARSPFFATTPTGTRFTYGGDAPFSGTGVRFVVTAVPEPALERLAIPGLLMLRRHRRRA